MIFNLKLSLDDASLWEESHLTENKRMADEEQRIKEIKQTPEYGTNAAKLRLIQKK